MFLLNTKRIFKSGWVNFRRNGIVSVASILVMTAALLVLGSVRFIQDTLDHSLEEIRNKVDVNIYFTIEAPEDKINNLKSSLEQLPEIESVSYVTADEALANFKERHQNDYYTLQALKELDNNPLGAYLNVKARETSQY